mgnify:CR=1 FL=1
MPEQAGRWVVEENWQIIATNVNLKLALAEARSKGVKMLFIYWVPKEVELPIAL